MAVNWEKFANNAKALESDEGIHFTRACSYCGSTDITIKMIQDLVGKSTKPYQAVCKNCHAGGPRRDSARGAMITWNRLAVE